MLNKVFLIDIGEKLKESITAAFGVNLTEFLINLIATLLLILIIRFFFWNKVTDFLEKKKDKIKNDYKENEELKKESLELKEKAEKELKESKVKAQEIVSDARKEALLEKETIISNAKLESEKIINDSRDSALKEKEEIIKDAKDEVVEIASLIASKMIDENIDQEKYNGKVLEELDK